VVLIKHSLAHTAGELNYEITTLILDYLHGKGESYTVMNEITGALECVKAEFYRKKVAPYENAKCHENGEVY